MLTDAKVRSAKPRPKSYKLVDANRLFLLVTPSGGKLWQWNYMPRHRELATVWADMLSEGLPDPVTLVEGS